MSVNLTGWCELLELVLVLMKAFVPELLVGSIPEGKAIALFAS